MNIRHKLSVRAASVLLATLLISGCTSGMRQAEVVRPRPAVPQPQPQPPIAIPSHPSAPINTNLSAQEALWHMRAALNVAALSCRAGKSAAGVASGYNRMLVRHKTALATANSAEIAPFRARYGAKWSGPYDAHATRLYNFFAMPAAQGQFCLAAQQVLGKVGAIAPDALPGYAPIGLAQLEAPFLRRSNFVRR